MAVNGVSVLAWDGPATPAQDIRSGLAALMGNGSGRALGARGGSRPGFDPSTVSGSTVTIPPRTVVIDPQGTNTQAPYLVAWRVSQTVTLDPAPSSNSRIDAVTVRLFDTIFDNSGQQIAQFGKISGTASSSPQRPAVPDGVVVLDWVTVPSSGAPTVQPGRVAVAAGGVLPGLSADRGLLYNGQVVTDTDTRTARVNWANGGLEKLLTDRNTFVQSGSAVVVTDTLGGFGIDFPTPFAAVPAIQVCSGDYNASASVALHPSQRSTTQFFGNARNAAGTGPAVSQSVRVEWRAEGLRP